MCLYPKIIQNRKYIANKKNGGNVPQAKDKRVLYVPVGCGNCMECRKQKARQWQVRLQEDIRVNKNGKFITLTFNEESIEEIRKSIEGIEGYDLDNEIATVALRRFLERWRKKYKKSLRHWMVTELGQTRTERIHMHGIMWTDEVEEISRIWKYGYITNGSEKWNNGKMIWAGENYVNEQTVNYIIKYVNKADETHKEYKSKVLTSPGIGKNYMDRHDSRNNKYNEMGSNETYKTRTGTKLNLPTYYRNQIYSEEEREKLWIEKLDKEERWVNGKKVDISNGDEDYYKILEIAREKNKRLGYGNNTINWERKRYENEKRNLKKKKNLED